MKNMISISILFFLFIGCNHEKENNIISTDESNEITKENKTPYQEYVSYSKSLEKTPQNATLLKEKYLSLVNEFTDDQIDSAFIVFEKFIMFMEIPIEDENILLKYDENETKKIEKKYADLGFKLGSSEGYYFLYTDVNFLKSVFYDKANPELKNYLDYQTLINRQMFSDGGLIISYVELADIILKTETFLNALKDTYYYDNVLEEYRWNIQILLYGMDNTPIITFEKPYQLIDDVKIAYQTIKADKTNKTRFIIEDHEKFLEKIQFNMFSVSADEAQLTLSYIEEKLGLN